MGLLGTVRSTITHPFVAGLLGGIIIVLLAYLDSKYRNVEREKSTYYKLFIVSTLVFATITYFVSSEHTKIDEFLDQNYDTKVPSLVPSSKGNFTPSNQVDMERPDEYVSKMMDSLPEPGTYDFSEPSKTMVTAKIKPQKSNHSNRSSHSGGNLSANRSK